MKNNSVSTPKFSFAVIKHHGTPNQAETLDGYKIYRKDRLFLSSFAQDYPEGVMCAPYDNHFVYIDPSPKSGRWSPMCTCGSPAAVVGYDAYKKDASAQGALVVCMSHAQLGRHSDGSQ